MKQQEGHLLGVRGQMEVCKFGGKQMDQEMRIHGSLWAVSGALAGHGAV